MSKTFFADVLMPLSVPNLYTYRIPRMYNDIPLVGKRVIVQFGSKKRYSGIVKYVHENPPTDYTAKYIEHVLDEKPIVTAEQFKFWEWMAQYYLCYQGEVLIAALPSGLKLASETKFILNHLAEIDESLLTDKELLIYEAFEKNDVLTTTEVMNIVQLKNVYLLLKSLIYKDVIIPEEEIYERFKPKRTEYIRLNASAESENALQGWFDKLEKAPKQLEVLLAYMQEGKPLSNNPKKVKKLQICKLTGTNSTTIKALVKKGLFEVYSDITGRLSQYEGAIKKPPVLEPFQQTAMDTINACFKTKDIVLIHGITGSGKTEIYVRMMLDVIAKGKQVLYLVPEIALTTQLIERLQLFFGNRIGVFHSKFNSNERVEVWLEVLKGKAGKYDIILGPRSAVFLPFQLLGLVVVDEEHETSYKQHNPAPRYNGRDASLVLAKLSCAKVILGSATPALETYWNAENERYGIVNLNSRYGGSVLPEIVCADIKEDSMKKKMKSHFTHLMMDEIQHALDNKEQVILFQNRRGYNPSWKCELCGWIPQCKNCDISLTFHKSVHRLRCHYCGYSILPPVSCPACGSTHLQMMGFGTQKIEEDIQEYFPKATVSRMDVDTTRNKNSYGKIISDFEQGKVDVLVGTQMVTKGLDFNNVGLVGILNADNMLFFPDFRAFERAYQLMAQVAGRAGRQKKKGKVIIQTWNTEHRIIKQVLANDYQAMFKDENAERIAFLYPPVVRLIALSVRHKESERVDYTADLLASNLRTKLGKRILGPEYPAVKRIRNQYHKNILIKVERKLSAIKIKEEIRQQIELLWQNKTCKPVRIVIDVDPM